MTSRSSPGGAGPAASIGLSVAIRPEAEAADLVVDLRRDGPTAEGSGDLGADELDELLAGPAEVLADPAGGHVLLEGLAEPVGHLVRAERRVVGSEAEDGVEG